MHKSRPEALQTYHRSAVLRAAPISGCHKPRMCLSVKHCRERRQGFAVESAALHAESVIGGKGALAGVGLVQRSLMRELTRAVPTNGASSKPYNF